MAIFTFIEEYDFSGKTIIPFCAHGTGGLAGSVKDIADALPDSAEVLEPIGVYRPDVDSAQPVINEWLDQLGYTEEKQAEIGMENDFSAAMEAGKGSETETAEMKIKITVGGYRTDCSYGGQCDYTGAYGTDADDTANDGLIWEGNVL